MAKGSRKQLKYGYWVCKKSNTYYLMCGYKARIPRFNPKRCYQIDRKLYDIINRKSLNKGRTKVK